MASNYLYFSLGLLILAAYACRAAAGRTLHEAASSSLAERHQQWMARYGRVYRDDSERELRFRIFKSNVEFIDSFNEAAGKSYKLSVNQFADLSNGEFKAARNGFKHAVSANAVKPSSSFGFRYQNATPPATMDWREEGAVTPVKDQGQCGCCWAFSAVAATEGLTKLTKGELISLSEQELVDCDRSGMDAGCEGGLMDTAFEFIQKNGGLTTEDKYPYKGVDGTCNANEASSPVAKINGYEDVPANSEESLLQAVANQPVSVAIDAGGYAFQFYSTGVFTGDCGTDLDHGVTAVGYGVSEDGTKYWLVKNSWGATWGEDGYVRMERDVDAQEGLCGIAMQPSFPTA